jgi:hypothetical protein
MKATEGKYLVRTEFAKLNSKNHRKFLFPLLANGRVERYGRDLLRIGVKYCNLKYVKYQ